VNVYEVKGGYGVFAGKSCAKRLYTQGSHGSLKVLKFEFGFFRTQKVLKLDIGADAEKS